MTENNCLTVTGKTLGANISGARVHNNDVIRNLDTPVCEGGARVFLHGNLAAKCRVVKTGDEICTWLRPYFLPHIEQAHLGCDFDFLKSTFGNNSGEPEIH